MPVVTGMGSKPRDSATKKLASALPGVLAEHMFKYMLYPKSSARAGWRREMSAFLRQLLVGVASFTKVDHAEVPARVAVVKTHYSAAEVFKVIDDASIDGLEAALDSMQSDHRLFEDPTDDELAGNLSDYGWALAESKSGQATVWSLTYKGEVVAKAG